MERGADVGIAFVGANHHFSRGCYGEIGPCHGGVCLFEYLSEVFPGGVCQVGGVAVARFGAHLLFKQPPYLFSFYMHCRQHNVARLHVHQLHYPFPEVAFHGLYAVPLEKRVQLTFFRKH